MGKKILFFIATLLVAINTSAQCNQTEQIVICDMTIVDGNLDTVPDGIINLNSEYLNKTGITLPPGNWFDPGFNFALNETNGDLFLWDLDNSTVADINPSAPVEFYEFQYYTNACGSSNPALTIQIQLGPFEGNPLPPSGPNAANVTICEAGIQSFDLFQVFESLPSPHQNGVWSFIGNLGDPSNFISLSQDGFFNAIVPYEPGGNLIDFDVFEFSYTVPGLAPCSESRTVNFKVEVIRDVDSGIPTLSNICESDLIAGAYDADIDLSEDQYLSNEDVEGTWSSLLDVTNQISNPGDSVVNLKEVYDNLYQNTPRFGCETFIYSYSVESRATLSNCIDKQSDVSFTFLEKVRPFSQNSLNNEFCEKEETPTTINLYDYLEFTTENGTLYDYPNENGTNWELISGPSSLGLLSNTGELSNGLNWNQAYVVGVGYTTPYRTQGEISLIGAEPGTYVFRYSVLPSYNCVEDPDLCKNSTSNCQHPCSPETTDVTIIIHPNNYAGEDTFDIVFCEGVDVGTSIDLISLLNTDGVQGDVYDGVLGSWTDADTGEIVVNPFVIPEIEDVKEFNFVYNTNTSIPIPNGCPDSASLSFTIYEKYSSGEGGVVEICKNNGVINLFDKLNSNPSDNGKWVGPNGYVSLDNIGVLDTSLAVEGEYVYTVPVNVNCLSESTTISIKINDAPNAGEDQPLVSVCKSENSIDLLDFIDEAADKNGVFIDIDKTELLSGTILNISDLASGTYNFKYDIQGNQSCNLESSNISIKIITPLNAGLSNTITICENANIINLFDYLLGSPNDLGVWVGPNGFVTTSSSAIIDPLINISGDYVYSLPENGACPALKTTIRLVVNPAQNAGDSQKASVCKSDIAINLYDLIDPLADDGGVFKDLSGTGNLNGNIFNVSSLNPGVYNFTYELEATQNCNSDMTNLSVEVLTVLPPAVNNQTFCFSSGASISDLLVTNATNYNWYDSLNSSEPLEFDKLLENGEDYFVASIDDNECESSRVKVTVTLLSFDSPNCDDGVGDGVSDNGDGENDELDLGGLPALFPNYEIQIFNRYGTKVYKGNINTEPFSGSGNVNMILGENLPTGVYFYVFNPKDGVTKPFQGDFYLSR